MDVQLGGFASSVFSFSSTAREPARLPQGAYIRPSYHQQGVWSTTVLTYRSTPRRGCKVRRPPEPPSHRDHQVQRPGQTLTSQVTLLTFAQTMSSPPVLSPTARRKRGSWICTTPASTRPTFLKHWATSSSLLRITWKYTRTRSHQIVQHGTT